MVPLYRLISGWRAAYIYSVIPVCSIELASPLLWVTAKKTS